LPCLALACLALTCLALPCLALPCLALPCLALPFLSFLSSRGAFNYARFCQSLLSFPFLSLPCLACATTLSLTRYPFLSSIPFPYQAATSLDEIEKLELMLAQKRVPM
jgi:hypothetical protein